MRIFPKPSESEVRRLLAEAGLPAEDLAPDALEDFLGCGPEGALTGVVGLEILGTEALLRSLAVARSERGRGYGKMLVAEAERRARARGVERVYLLTTTAAEFFARLGYHEVPRDEAPPSIRVTSEFSVVCPTNSVLMLKVLASGVGGARRV